MAHAHNLDQEFWRPPVQNVAYQQEVSPAVEVCPRCNTEYVAGSHFCHICGMKRDAEEQMSAPTVLHFLDIRTLSKTIGLSIASLVAFIIGVACTIAAFVTGLIYTATTVVDWQAVQIWRIEWLLAATVAFVAGILLKRPATS